MNNAEKGPVNTIRDLNIDILRIIASIAVIWLHVSADNWVNVTPDSYDFAVYNLYDGISRWCVGVFFMISGALMLSKDRTLSQIWKKNIPRVVKPLILWSFLYALYGYISGSFSSLKSAVVSFLNGGKLLWFLFALIGLYVITPLLRRIVIDRRLTNYFLLIGLLLTFVIPQAANICSIVSSSFGSFIRNWFNKFSIYMTGGFVVYYVLGHYLYNNTISARSKKLIYFCGAASFIITPLFNWLYARHTGELTELFFQNLTVNVLFECIAVFLLFKESLKNKHYSEKERRIITGLSKYSFGVYLIHVFVLLFLKNILGFSIRLFNPIVSIPLVTVVVAVISYTVSAMLNRIPFVRDHFV